VTWMSNLIPDPLPRSRRAPLGRPRRGGPGPGGSPRGGSLAVGPPLRALVAIGARPPTTQDSCHVYLRGCPFDKGGE